MGGQVGERGKRGGEENEDETSLELIPRTAAVFQSLRTKFLATHLTLNALLVNYTYKKTEKCKSKHSSRC